jgi:hypothetical protein
MFAMISLPLDIEVCKEVVADGMCDVAKCIFVEYNQVIRIWGGQYYEH